MPALFTGTSTGDLFVVTQDFYPDLIRVIHYTAGGTFLASYHNINEDVHINAGGGSDTIRVQEALAWNVSANGGEDGNSLDKDVAEFYVGAAGSSTRTWDAYTAVNRQGGRSGYFNPEFEDVVVRGTAGPDVFRVYDKGSTTALGVYLGDGAGDRVELHNVASGTANRNPDTGWTQVDQSGYWSTYVGADVEDARVYGTPGADTFTLYGKAYTTAFGVFLQGGTADTLNIWGVASGTISNGQNQEQGVGFSVIQPAGQYAYYAGYDAETLWVWGTNGNDSLTVDAAVGRSLNLGGLGGNDYISSGFGADLIYGDDGNDTIFGGGGSDRLYGNAGADYLNGGAGVNLLYGGLDSTLDTLAAGGGKTIFVYSGSAVYSSDFNTVRDALVGFVNGKKSSAEPQVVRSWTESQVIDASYGLYLLGQRTNNTKLAKLPDDPSDGTHPQTWNAQVFERWGDLGTDVLADNNRVGTIRVPDLAFNTNQAVNPVANTVIHEIGHNWDYPAVNGAVAGFRSLSGWVTAPTPSGWAYTAGTPFVSEYAKTDPYEDWSETLAATFGLSPARYTGTGAAATKVNALNNWLNSLID